MKRLILLLLTISLRLVGWLSFMRKDNKNKTVQKLFNLMRDDVRVIIIKLADRLHNMRTLSFKSEFKQKENSLETMEIFVPLAYYIGAYRIKSELEDLSLRYLKPDAYFEIVEKLNQKKSERDESVSNMLNEVSNLLTEHNIDLLVPDYLKQKNLCLEEYVKALKDKQKN